MLQCKQCGRYLLDDCFDKYPSRSTGQRNTTTGRRRVCRDCFNFNQRVDRAYKAKLSGAATLSQLELLGKTEVFFKSQIAKGFEPMGASARSLKGQTEQKRRRELTFDDYMEELGISNNADQFVEELQSVLAKAQVDGSVDDEIGDDLLAKTMARVELLKDTLKPVVKFKRRLTHEMEHLIRSVLRCHL